MLQNEANFEEFQNLGNNSKVVALDTSLLKKQAQSGDNYQQFPAANIIKSIGAKKKKSGLCQHKHS